LNALGALPPLSASRSAHCAPQNVTSVVAGAADGSASCRGREFRAR
jgi:hypothetical protein